MKWIFLLLLGICGANAATHSLKYFYTAVSGIDFPEFTTVGQVDDAEFIYFDSNTKTAVPKTEWMKREGAAYWDSESQNFIGQHQTFKANIQILKDRFNQSKSTGVHTFQNMYGCEWDEETGPTGGSFQYGYDGEDFISLDVKELRWIAPVQQAFITKQKWDNNRAALEHRKNYLTQECIDWLKKYVDYGKSTLRRTVSPSVSLLQKSPSSPVTCHATGFYPSRVMVFWRRDGEQVYVDVEHGEVLHNEDGTFQKSVDLTVKPEDLDSGRYDCVVQLPGVQEDVVTRLERSVVKTNLGNTGRTIPGSDVSTGPIIGGVVGLLLLVAIISGVVIWMKKKGDKKGFAQANTSDDGSNSSNNTEQKA